MCSPRACTALGISTESSSQPLNLSLLSVASPVPAAGLDHCSPQPCPPEVVFHSYSPAGVCEVPLALRNRDKVSAGMWGFNTVLEGERDVIPVGHSTASSLLQHIHNKMPQHLGSAGWWKSSQGILT